MKYTKKHRNVSLYLLAKEKHNEHGTFAYFHLPMCVKGDSYNFLNLLEKIR